MEKRELENKIDWIFEGVRFLLENTPTISNEEKRNALIEEAERIEIDEGTTEEVQD